MNNIRPKYDDFSIKVIIKSNIYGGSVLIGK